MKRITVADIAEEVGVSKMTVSRALNGRDNVDDATRERILSAAREMGYRPNRLARSLFLKRSYTLGVIVPEMTPIFFPETIRGIESTASERGYHVIVTNSMESFDREQKQIHMLEEKQVDGLLLSTAETLSDPEPYKPVIERGLPLVFFDRCVRGFGASCVRINDSQSAQQLTEHMISHGHTRIAHLAGPHALSIASDRREGYENALKAAGIPVRDEYIVVTGLEEDEAYQAMKKLLDLPKEKRPTAVVAVNDPVAFGAMQAIEESDLHIPEDIAIVGFSNDIRSSMTDPPLTTVDQKAHDLGANAARVLIDQIEGKRTEPEEVRIKAELVIRNSCGCESRGFNTEKH